MTHELWQVNLKNIYTTALFSFAFACGSSSFASPITDTVVVGEREWAQVDLFRKVSWNEIDVLCPGGARECLDGSELKGFSLAGWNWASVTDVNALFNTYLTRAGYEGDALLGPGADVTVGRPPEVDFTELFFADFRPSYSGDGREISFVDVYGLQADESGIVGQVFVPTISRAQIGDSVSYEASTQPQTSKDWVLSGGAWFYRASTPVPVPGTLSLVAVSLMGLRIGIRRSNHTRKTVHITFHKAILRAWSVLKTLLK